MNFEAQSNSNITIDAAYRVAERSLRKEELKLKDFEDLYGKENVDRDREEIARLEIEFQKGLTPENEQTQRLARTFEGIFHDEAELSEWLGPNASTIKTSRYDDVKNGVDSIAEFRESDSSASWLALGIDVTFSSDLTKKFDRIKTEIDRGTLAEVKYFSSEHLHIRGEMKNIPRVVVGADTRTIKQLAELWLEKDKDALKALGAHPVQFQILEEMLLELKTFADYAEKKGKHELAAAYEKAIRTVSGILDEKRTTIEDTGERDSVFEGINDNLKRFY